MKKLSDIVNNTPDKKIHENSNSIKDILESSLIIESLNEDLTSHNLNIIGINDATSKIEHEFSVRLIEEQLKLCSNIYNNFRVGHFEYLDHLVETLQNTLSKLKK